MNLIERKHCFVFQLAAALSVGWLAVSYASGAEGLTWKREADSFALLKGEKFVWRFNHSTNLATKPCFDPVALPGGSSLTWQSPPDHRWHYALWFSWKYINGINYWEENKQGVSDGATEWSNVRCENRSDFSARITMDLRYRPQRASEPVLIEKRAIEISAPAADGSYAIDWTLVFTAGKEDLKFDRTLPVTNKAGVMVPGGYAGLSARLAKELSDVRLVATADIGEPINNRYGYAAIASDFNGRIDQGEAGIAMLEHPSNLRSPTRWYVITDPSKPFWYMNASWLQLEPYLLSAGKTFTLRYRVWIHPGRWDPQRLAAEQARYSK